MRPRHVGFHSVDFGSAPCRAPAGPPARLKPPRLRGDVLSDRPPLPGSVIPTPDVSPVFRARSSPPVVARERRAGCPLGPGAPSSQAAARQRAIRLSSPAPCCTPKSQPVLRYSEAAEVCDVVSLMAWQALLGRPIALRCRCGGRVGRRPRPGVRREQQHREDLDDDYGADPVVRAADAHGRGAPGTSASRSTWPSPPRDSERSLMRSSSVARSPTVRVRDGRPAPIVGSAEHDILNRRSAAAAARHRRRRWSGGEVHRASCTRPPLGDGQAPVQYARLAPGPRLRLTQDPEPA
jgi:hypothetical protein